MRQRIVRPFRKHLGYRYFTRGELGFPIVGEIGAVHRIVDPPYSQQRVEIVRIERKARSKKLRACAIFSGLTPLFSHACP